jgi:hypothetical protein
MSDTRCRHDLLSGQCADCGRAADRVSLTHSATVQRVVILPRGRVYHLLGCPALEDREARLGEVRHSAGLRYTRSDLAEREGYGGCSECVGGNPWPRHRSVFHISSGMR